MQEALLHAAKPTEEKKETEEVLMQRLLQNTMWRKAVHSQLKIDICMLPQYTPCIDETLSQMQKFLEAALNAPFGPEGASAARFALQFAVLLSHDLRRQASYDDCLAKGVMDEELSVFRDGVSPTALVLEQSNSKFLGIIEEIRQVFGRAVQAAFCVSPKELLSKPNSESSQASRIQPAKQLVLEFGALCQTVCSAWKLKHATLNGLSQVKQAGIQRLHAGAPAYWNLETTEPSKTWAAILTSSEPASDVDAALDGQKENAQALANAVQGSNMGADVKQRLFAMIGVLPEPRSAAKKKKKKAGTSSATPYPLPSTKDQDGSAEPPM